MRSSATKCIAGILPGLLLLFVAWAAGAGTPSPVHHLDDCGREARAPGSEEAAGTATEGGPGVTLLQAKPDLTVIQTWTVPEAFCRYAVVDIHSIVKNIGTAAAVDSFFFDMWFDGENIGFARIESLAAGATLELVLEGFAWPGDTLSHAVTAMADTDQEIDEELETNNIDLEYFAADLCTTCTFITTPFEEGWNWFSLNVDDADMSLDHVLASLDSNGVYIKNQTAFAEYVPDWNGWFGTLTSLNCHDTYMIKMANADTLDFCGFPYDVSAPLGLPPGWSWISYLPRDTMVVDDALGSLGANGEYIKNQTAFAEYIPDWSGWFGTLTDMCPGDGFKIRMAAADTLVYPDSVEVSGGKGTLRLPGAVGDDVCHWKVHPHEFETSGSVVAEVLKRGRKCTRPGDRLGAFCGDDCRGTAQAVVNPYGESMFYLTVYGGGAGEVLHFRYFESSTGLTRSISESVEFVEDMTLGRSTCPVVLAVSPEVPLDRTGYDGMFMLENSPDPFTLSTVLRFRLAEAGPLTLTIYNTCGQRVATLRDAYMETGTHEVVWDGMAESGRPAQDGVYFCRMRCADGLFTEKVILMR